MDNNSLKNKVSSTDDDQAPAANLIRNKLDRIYGEAPNAKEEIKEVKALESQHASLSKHQRYMEQLTESGRSLAEIQTAWHEYYQNLSDTEKHEVWQEFYKEHEKKRTRQSDHDKSARKITQQTLPPVQPITKPTEIIGRASHQVRARAGRATNIKDDILNKVTERARKSQAKPHAHSLLFGLAMGSLAVFILLFSFFNERFITPFIRPSQHVSATSIIVDPNQSGDVGPEPKIIIPKINIEAPVVYDEESIDEKAVQKALERGVVHYPITPNPGEKGNAVIVGHSSSNILNSGKYKFAFLLLKSLETNDTFMIHKDGKRYVYKVYNKFVTSPTDVSVLNPTDKAASVTLITCDPPGSSKNRLIIQAEQIFPNPTQNVASSVDTTTQAKPEELGGNSPSLWSRITNWF